ncbi:MAG TPA: hypothetical protein VF765_06745 [Polyangiaceae bacterium]
MRSMFVSPLFALALTSLVSVACVDPQQDYNDYVNRTADAHVPPPIGTSDAGIDTGPLYAPDAGFSSNLYLMSCLTAQAEGDTTKASNSVGHLSFMPTAGGGGTVTYGDQTLKINPTSLSDVTGAYAETGGGTIDAHGEGTVKWGMTSIPGDGDTVNPGQALVFSSSQLDLHIESETQVCANFTGNLTSPSVLPVGGPCVFRLLPSATSPLPKFQLSDFHCP